MSLNKRNTKHGCVGVLPSKYKMQGSFLMPKYQNIDIDVKIICLKWKQLYRLELCFENEKGENNMANAT
ncbi:hypothetical protein [Fusibacter sp. JL216-2]|uniref:hypothetical protein n=1 Tax=Fusibacter sp. JL216-2 TaxID=3071453 RepID=UPI003D32B482